LQSLSHRRCRRLHRRVAAASIAITSSPSRRCWCHHCHCGAAVAVVSIGTTAVAVAVAAIATPTLRAVKGFNIGVCVACTLNPKREKTKKTYHMTEPKEWTRSIGQRNYMPNAMLRLTSPRLGHHRIVVAAVVVVVAPTWWGLALECGTCTQKPGV